MTIHTTAEAFVSQKVPVEAANRISTANTKTEHFSAIMDTLQGKDSCTTATEIPSYTHAQNRLNGDYISSFAIANPTAAEKNAAPQGMGAASIYASIKNTDKNAAKTVKKIDKTSNLYAQALELESFFVKIMLDSMRSSLGTNTLTGKDSFAGKMYQDMMYEELSRTVTRNAGLGLADQIYLQLNNNTM